MSRLTERIENFNRAFEIFKEIVSDFDEDKILTHLALVKSFSICFELACKCLKDYMNERGVIVNYPKEIIKEAFNKDTIKDAQLWMNMLEARNSTSHEYNMDKVNKYLFEMRTIYCEELSRLQIRLDECLNSADGNQKILTL